jgi:peptidoglycan hydrolase-like amidase
LCQTGAAAMAAAGADFRAILEHYYPNTVLAPLALRR